MKRRTTWEQNDPYTIASTEFFDQDGGGLDHRPSVYLVDASTDDELEDAVVRVTAEHTVSFLDRPPKGIPPADVAHEDQRLSTTVGRTSFAYANNHHREILLGSDDDVVALARLLVVDRVQRRLDYSNHEALLDYARDRLAESDPEWTAVMELPRKKKWRRAADKRRMIPAG